MHVPKQPFMTCVTFKKQFIFLYFTEGKVYLMFRKFIEIYNGWILEVPNAVLIGKLTHKQFAYGIRFKVIFFVAISR